MNPNADRQRNRFQRRLFVSKPNRCSLEKCINHALVFGGIIGDRDNYVYRTNLPREKCVSLAFEPFHEDHFIRRGLSWSCNELHSRRWKGLRILIDDTFRLLPFVRLCIPSVPCFFFLFLFRHESFNISSLRNLNPRVLTFVRRRNVNAQAFRTKKRGFREEIDPT